MKPQGDTPVFQIGDRVKYVVDKDEEPMHGLVSGVIYRKYAIQYMVAWGQSGETEHDDFELEKVIETEANRT